MNFDGQKICGVQDHVGGVDCAWPFLDVTVHADGTIGDISVADAIEQAIAGWNRVCGIRLAMATNPRTAHIAVTYRRIDGPGGTLAMCELPCGFTASRWRQLALTADVAEALTIADNPPSNRIDAVRMFAHELGHGLGLGHLSSGSLMQPTYSTSIRWPQREDIKEVVLRYGQPAAEQPDTPPVDPPADNPPGGADDSVWNRLFPCLLTYGVDLFAALTPDERKGLLEFGIGIWRQLRPADREKLRMLSQYDRNQSVHQG